MITRVKGTQDFLDLGLLNYCIDQAKSHLQEYNFIEIQTPILEHIELFKRSLGVYTDVVGKEMFLIDNKGQELELCLRPEMTASIVRAFVENGIDTLPWQVFTWGPAFRYERPQKGRFRQFHQISIEMIGAQSLFYDVQCITMLDRFFAEKLHLDTYALHINYLGTPAERALYTQKLATFLTDHTAAICDICRIRKEHNVMRVFDCKNESCMTLYTTQAPIIIDYLSKESVTEWNQLQDQLRLLGVSFSCKPTLVRGLDYYNKTVFEFVSENLGAQNAFCGGGRYDYLVSHLGGRQDQPSIGAAIGLERVLMLLEPIKATLAIPYNSMLCIIIPLTAEQHALALFLADHLRGHKLCVDVLFDGESLKSMVRKANKIGSRYALFLGQDEQQAQTVTIKDMQTGKTQTMPQIECAAYIKSQMTIVR